MCGWTQLASMAVGARLRRRVLRAYVKPGHPTALSSPATVAKHFGISKSAAKEILEHEDGYTLHREYHRPSLYNPYFVHTRREQVQADLIDVSTLSAHNDGVRFLLLFIDIMTKKIWVYPLRSKAQQVMKTAIRQWLELLRTKPTLLVTDRGLEFTSNTVQQLLASHEVEWRPAFGTLKACIAERVNKTLQVIIYKYLTATESLRYIDVLDKLVKSYNRRGHRSLEGMSPEKADLPANEGRVQAIFHARYTALGRRRRQRGLPFKVGDLVRVKTLAKKISSSARAYAEQFHGEYFVVTRINRTLPVAMYYLRSLDTGEHIEGGFYANELQRQRGDLWKVEAVLDERVRRGRRELLVKWKYFGDAHNEWIPSENVEAAF